MQKSTKRVIATREITLRMISLKTGFRLRSLWDKKIFAIKDIRQLLQVFTRGRRKEMAGLKTSSIILVLLALSHHIIAFKLHTQNRDVSG